MVYINSHLEVKAYVSQVIHGEHTTLGDLALNTNVHLVRASGAELWIIRISKLQGVAHEVGILSGSTHGCGRGNILVLQIGRGFGCAFRVDGTGAQRGKK